MRRSSLRRSSVVALASASVGLAAPIPEPGFSLLGGQTSGSSNVAGCNTNLLSGNSLNGLISSLTNFIGQSGSVKTGTNVQAQIEDIFKSFGLNPAAASSSIIPSGTSSAIPSPSSSPKGSISGSSIGNLGTINVGNLASAANNAVKQVESTTGNIVQQAESAVNGLISNAGKASVDFSNPFGSGSIQIGKQASISPSSSSRVSSPTASPVIPTVSPSVVNSSPTASPVIGSGSFGVPAQAVQGALAAGQNIANSVTSGTTNVVNQIGDQLKGATNTALNIGSSVVKSGQSAVTSPISVSPSVSVTGSTSAVVNNPLSAFSSLLGSGSSNNLFSSLLNPTANKGTGSGLTSLFQFGGSHA